MAKQKLEQGSKINQDDKNQLSKELNSLLKAFEPYKFIFDGRVSNNIPPSSPEAITIKLNKEKTLLCLKHNDNVSEIENDGKIIDENTYNNVRTTLQNKRRLPENKWDASFKSAKQQIIAYLIKENKLEDQEGFLKEFQQFINALSEVPYEFIDCSSRLMGINFDDWNIDDSTEDDPRLVELEEIHKKMLASFDSYKSMGENHIELKNQAASDTTVNTQEEEQKTDDTLLPFEKKYPKQSYKIKRIFEILNDLERCEALDCQIEIIAGKLGLSLESTKKLKGYFNVSSITKSQKTINFIENNHWYTDEDMNSYGRVLEKYCVDFDSQFSNRLTEDGIKTLPSIESLRDNQPRYISYNIGGKANEGNSGIHWIAIVLVKRGEIVTILYKDSKGDWNNSSEAIESLFKERYKSKVEFIRHLQVEQEDDASCGPMTINNLEIMALKVKEANDEGKDGVTELIRLFKGESGGVAFTTQDQVPSIRISHSLQNKSYSKANLQQDTNIDDLSTIITKLKLSDNDISRQDSESNEKDEIKSYIHKINKYYDQLKDWGVDELKSWSKEHKGQLSKNFANSTEAGEKICEAIAVMDQANQLATGGHRLRDTQKAAILIFIQTNSKGHISQINTGEGKTTIISVVAALKVMQGYKGHVITSNNVLAADGVKDKKLFYDLLNITIADNNPDDKYTDGPKFCYSQDVVYGSIPSFQFDWLRDSFEQLKTLGGIDFNNIWVMLDEIDSLLIDQGSNIAKLSGPFPGMESLRYVYINIWVALAKTEEQVTQQILEKLKQKADQLSKDSKINEDEKQLEYEEYEDSLRESFLDEIKKRIKNQKDDLINKKVLAKHLHQYVEDSLERWIEHAFTAKYQYNENVEYKVIKGKDGENIIIPVDNQNTGVSMKNTILSNGLHQFLQIKHNLCLTYESLTSCYVSNLDYIKKYGSKLSGLTGTLGSDSERNLLGSVFNLGFSVIPPFKPKQFIQFPAKVSVDEQFVNDVAIAALAEIARIQREIKTPRAVLIVCASILDVEIIAKEIVKEGKEAGLTARIIKYIDETDVHITENTLDICDIVVATNLAGRGTDFKTSDKLESNGGLHVIEAFLPCNKRVEDQGLGRTGRQGNKGTGQIVVRSSEVETLGITVNNTEYINFDEIIKCRDELETIRVNDIHDNKIIELEFKGRLFNKFSSQYGALKKEHKTGIGTDVIKWIYVLRDLKEKWAFWLEKQAYTAKSIKEIVAKEDHLLKAVDQEYNKFLKEAEAIINGTISHNPFYSICLSERYLENSTDKSDREKAKSELEHALQISESSELLYSAYIKLFEIAIEDGGQVLERYKKAVAKIFFYPLESGCPDYKKRAIENLQKAAIALAIEHDYLQKLVEGKNTNSDNQDQESVLASIIINQEQDPTNTINNQQNQAIVRNPNLFVKHLQARLLCLAAYKGNIESLIKQIKGEEKLEKPEDSIGPNDSVIIDSKVPRYLSKLDSQNELKKYITDRSVDELEYVGMSSVYQVRKIHDVHEEVITGAQIQIGGAFALLASAAIFPVLLPVNGPLAGAMISEGITDIITALIQQGQSAFNKKDYIKGKVISYGISILTMGIGALMSSTKILTKSVNACRSLATKLRAVKGPFAGICKFLANRLDKLAVYLEQMIEKIEFARKTAVEQAKYLTELKDVNKLQQFQQLQKSLKISDIIITHGQKINQILTQSVIGAVKGVVISVAIEKIVIASLNNLMTALQPIIKEKVHSAVSGKIKDEYKKGTFNNVSDLEINQAIAELFNTSLEEDIKDVSKEIGLGILRHSSNWKMQLATLAFESILSCIDIATCTNAICNKFIANLAHLSIQQANNNDSDKSELIETIITQISEPVSAIIYGKIVAITGKAVVTLPKALYRGYKAHQEKKADKKAIADMSQKLNQIDAADDSAKAENIKCAHDAVSETLGLDNNKGSKQLADATNLGASRDGASIEDTKQLFIQNGIEVTSCGIEDARFQFGKQGSDRGVICLSNDQGLGHAIAVTMEGGCPMVTEGGNKISLDQYKQKHGYTSAEFIIPKGVNSSTLQDIQHKCNLNRIVRATHPIDYVGQGGGMKFGEPPRRRQTSPYTMRGSAVLKASDGVTGGVVSNAPGHPTDHLTHVGFSDKESHTVFAHGKEQQQYLANTASKNPAFIAKVKEAQDTAQRVICTLPIEELLETKLLKKDKEKYMQATTREKGRQRNMKFVTFVIDPAVLESNKPYHIQTMYPVIKEKKQEQNTGLQGINIIESTNIGSINGYFGEYTLNAIEDILELRVNDVGLNNVSIARDCVFQEHYNNLQRMIDDLIDTKSRIILAPLNLYNKHAVGIMAVKNQDNGLNLYYIDPSNENMPDRLKQIFIDNDLHIEQLPVNQQKYANCGPEVIENFMLYLISERISQEESIIYHSQLVEQQLVNKANNLTEVMDDCTDYQESVNDLYDTEDQEEMQLVSKDVDIEALLDSCCSIEYPAPISITTEDTKLFNKDKDLNTNSGSNNNAINDQLIREQKAFFVYSQGNIISNEAWAAESDENDDRSAEAEQKFTESLQFYREAVKLSPTNITYKHTLDIISLKIEGNHLFSEGVALAEIAYAIQEEANKLVTNQEFYQEVLNHYQQALELYQAAQARFREGWYLSKDLRFNSCIEIVDNSIGSIQEVIEEIQSKIDGELIEKPDDITVELFRQDEQNDVSNDLMGNMPQEPYCIQVV